MKYLLLATCLMALNFCNGQTGSYLGHSDWSEPKIDTIPCFMLVVDTTHRYFEYYQILSCDEISCKDKAIHESDPQFGGHTQYVKEDRGIRNPIPVFIKGYHTRPNGAYIMRRKYTDELPKPRYYDDHMQPLKSSILIFNIINK